MIDWWVETKGDHAPYENILTVKEIKRRVPMAYLLKHYGAVSEIPIVDGWAAIRCPFHKDSNPSASVNARLNRFRCHVCDVSGDVIDVVSQAERLSMKEAMKWIRQHLL